MKLIVKPESANLWWRIYGLRACLELAPVKISFSEELIEELSDHWEMSKDEVLSKLKS